MNRTLAALAAALTTAAVTAAIAVFANPVVAHAPAGKIDALRSAAQSEGPPKALLVQTALANVNRGTTKPFVSC